MTSVLETAQFALKQIEKKCDVAKLLQWFDYRSLSNEEKYDIGRQIREIEGLQMLIYLHGGNLDFSTLPVFYKPFKEKKDSYD